MPPPDSSLPPDALAFFGSITAAATHDLKNVLAITNENAGLLGDLSGMAISGRSPVPPEKAAQISDRIKKQVKRADRILKLLNRFSHSMDQPEASVDPAEMVRLILTLAERRIHARGVMVEMDAPRVPWRIRTQPFFLMNLVFRVILEACEAVGETKKIIVSFDTDSGSPEIGFTLETVKPTGLEPLFSAPDIGPLAASLKMKLKKNNAENRFSLAWENGSV